MNCRLVILGAGGHGRVVAEIAALNGYDDIVFVDERYPELNSNLIWPVVGKNFSDAVGETHCFVALGNCRARRERVLALVAAGRVVPVLIHPQAAVSAHARLGAGSVVMAQAAVNPGADIGRAVIINTGATVDHDCHLGDGVHVSPGAHLAGGVRVGVESWIGIGAVAREMTTIGAGVMVGAGAVVVRPVADGAIVTGVPARSGK
jgi:sugar O-acyltransferase (sialic acid O-acetyltransferase NeuD family)